MRAVTKTLRHVAIGLTGAAVLVVGMVAPAAAEGRIRIAEQFGIGYLPLHVIRYQKLIEKHGKAQGVDIQVEWAQLSGGAAMNDALLSDSIDVGAGGVGPLLTIWDRTKGNANVMGIATLNAMPLFLTTTNPNVKTVKDFTEKDKIALPAVKVSVQARTLQMAAEQAFGEGKFDALDRFTVSLPHPDGTTALLSGSSITGHFSAPPFQYQQLQDPKVRKVLSSYDVLGGASTFNSVWSKKAFRDSNPKTFAAFVGALREAMDVINKDHKQAATIYLATNKADMDIATIVKMLADPDIQFTVAPKNTSKYAEFMHKVGALKNKPASWKDYFFEDVHGEQGS
ncbi:ABC transporter substrate-binding protein [Azospirillum sp. RWY-5-1]|uniref:ABC transporter substrate-binding protein n=1 Tax=Azospirillum oleiclasticum TaxID=2735135 RepID=A0ABX2T617_9PROT|nr:ABC transporter substrate-binding protein [Azospirillum oleiclasticum]NYZ12484.1 ABC transporter substrate-binding protein [Azospirillum oleiclasticum]NYZ19644.1 ABC transporter substrate-binding protein [Azospirillum oleiclasticum]